MPGSRRGSRIGDAEAPPNRRSSVLVDEEHARKLISDVSNEEAEGMLTQVQTVSTAFRGFSGDIYIIILIYTCTCNCNVANELIINHHYLFNC